MAEAYVEYPDRGLKIKQGRAIIKLFAQMERNHQENKLYLSMMTQGSKPVIVTNDKETTIVLATHSQHAFPIYQRHSNETVLIIEHPSEASWTTEISPGETNPYDFMITMTPLTS